MSQADCPFCRKLADLDALPPEDVVWRFPARRRLAGAVAGITTAIVCWSPGGTRRN